MSFRVALAVFAAGAFISVPSALASNGPEPSCAWTPVSMLKATLGLSLSVDRDTTGVNGNTTDCAYVSTTRTTVTSLTIGYVAGGGAGIQAAYNLVAATPGKTMTLVELSRLGRKESDGLSAFGTLNGKPSKTAYLEINTSRYSPYVQINVADGKNTYALSLSEYRVRGAKHVRLADPSKYVKGLEQIASRLVPKFYSAG